MIQLSQPARQKDICAAHRVCLCEAPHIVMLILSYQKVQTSQEKKKNFHLVFKLQTDWKLSQIQAMAPCVSSPIGNFERKWNVQGQITQKLFKWMSFKVNFRAEPLRHWDAATILSDFCFLFKDAATVLADLAALSVYLQKQFLACVRE